jgi:Leucine-rich repeat (LRR) protein
VTHSCHQILILDDNRLAELPSDIGGLSRLERLSAAGNRLTALPPSLGRLTALVSLNVARNQLEILPEVRGAIGPAALYPDCCLAESGGWATCHAPCKPGSVSPTNS